MNVGQELNELRGQIKKEHSRLLYFSQRINEVEKSRSWRATAPLHKANNIKRNISIAPKEESAIYEINELRYKLYSLGLSRAYQDILKAYRKRHFTLTGKLAAWELAIYHADKYSKDGAKKSLKFLKAAEWGDTSEEHLRRKTTIKAEGLIILNKKEEARKIIQGRLEEYSHADLCLAMANTYDDPIEKLFWINKALSLSSLTSIDVKKERKDTPYDSITNKDKKSNINGPKVSVIIPAYNSEETIHTSIDSMLNQTWKNLEILIVDDCSTDGTYEVIKRYAKQDKRIKVFKSKKNSGPYVCRNIALKEATGEFVTCNDADDWSHPERIAIQAADLIKNQKYTANTTSQTRVTSQLEFHRKGMRGGYVQPCFPSLMFRKDLIVGRLGYWDCVRFAADSEYINRIRLEFGDDSIKYLGGSPQVFQRQDKTTLTNSPYFGIKGYPYGARKEYRGQSSFYHESSGDIKLPHIQNKRLFWVPGPMLPDRVISAKYDVVLAADLRKEDFTHIKEKIEKHLKQKKKIGLVQINDYKVGASTNINPELRKFLKNGSVDLLVYGQEIQCDVLYIEEPHLLKVSQKFIPCINARKIFTEPNSSKKPNSQKYIKEFFSKRR